jgi:hypothetical protein
MLITLIYLLGFFSVYLHSDTLNLFNLTVYLLSSNIYFSIIIGVLFILAYILAIHFRITFEQTQSI